MKKRACWRVWRWSSKRKEKWHLNWQYVRTLLIVLLNITDQTATVPKHQRCSRGQNADYHQSDLPPHHDSGCKASSSSSSISRANRPRLSSQRNLSRPTTTMEKCKFSPNHGFWPQWQHPSPASPLASGGCVCDSHRQFILVIGIMGHAVYTGECRK